MYRKLLLIAVAVFGVPLVAHADDYYIAAPIVTPSPNSLQSFVGGINDDGYIVGTYVDEKARGFLSKGITFMPFDVPFADATETQAHGINRHRHIVGSYRVGEEVRGFVRVGSAFTSFEVELEGVTQTTPDDINSHGTIVGTYYRDAVQHGFVREPEGKMRTLDAPFTDARETTLTGINDAGIIVGYYEDTNGVDHGFMVDAQGRFSLLTSPERLFRPEGINDRGVIVSGAYLYVDGTFRPLHLTLPTSSVSTLPFGLSPRDIDNQGRIVGDIYQAKSAAAVGFVALPLLRL